MQRNRFLCILSLILVLVLFLTGCTTNAFYDLFAERTSLSVYIYIYGTNWCYVDDVYAFYNENRDTVDLDVEVFSSIDEMESRIQAELAAGQGPDVILTDHAFGLDMMQLAKDGMFYDLTDIIAADESYTNDDYYLSIMEAGQLNDRQYVVPLSFTLPTFVSTAENLREIGIDPETDTTLEVYEKLLAYLKASGTPQISGPGGHYNTIELFMRSMGKTPVSYETGDVDLEGGEERLLIELGAEVFKHKMRWLDVYMSTPYSMLDSNDWVMDYAKVPLIFSSHLVSPYQIQYCCSIFAEASGTDDVEIFFVSDQDGNYHALIQEFAAVNANTKHPELAWQLLRRVLDHENISGMYTALSPNRNVNEAYVSEAMTNARPYYTFDMQKLPQDIGDQLLDACDRVTDAYIDQPSPLTMIFRDALDEYKEGTISVNTLVETVADEAELYLIR